MKGNNTLSGILTSFTSPYAPKIWRTSSLETDGSKLNITRVPWFKSLSDGFSCKINTTIIPSTFVGGFAKQKQSSREVLLLVVLQIKNNHSKKYLWYGKMDVQLSPPQRLVLQRTHCVACRPDIKIRYHHKTPVLCCSVEGSDIPVLLKWQ
jgi:hypothetical protein